MQLCCFEALVNTFVPVSKVKPRLDPSAAPQQGKNSMDTVSAANATAPGAAAQSWKKDMLHALQKRSQAPEECNSSQSSRDSCQSTATQQRTAAEGSVTSGSHSVAFTDLEIGRVIGIGSFGRVSIARHRKDGSTYVLKAISKANCIKDGQARHVLDEKALLARVSCSNHPFIVNLKGSFQDAKCLYLLLEYVQGGDLFCFLREYPTRYARKVPEDFARFYAAQIVLGLEHLHSQNIAFRDLKPENLLMGADGYLKITDFGFAKEVRGGSTYTTCGTPDYVAPEVILSQGHGPAADMWSLGCVVYEIMYGYPPFYANGDVTKTYQQVLAHKVQLPSHWSLQAKDLITRLLHVDPRQRLGCGTAGMAALKAHPWFQGLDWKCILGKRYQPPHKPRVSSATDTSNFDDFSKLAPMQHQFSLTPEQQHLFAGF